MKKSFLFLALVCSLLLMSCSKEQNNEPEVFSVGKGMFVLNEGNYTNSTASLSFYDFDKKTTENNLFFRVNDAPLGDVAQSLMLLNDNLYIVVNNSKDIYKVDAKTIQYKSQLRDFGSPRYIMSVGNGKAYVTDISVAGIWVINPNTMTHTKFISTGKSTEMMVRVGDEVFVSNWSKAYVDAPNNTIQVIDCVNDSLVAEIEVAQEPKAMVLDKNENIWVICNGGWDPTSLQDPALICFDPATRQIIKRFDFTPGVDSPDGLAIDGAGENIYFMNGGYSNLNVYKMSVDAMQVPDTPLITSDGKWFYSIIVNPKNNEIYITEAKPISNGNLLRYSSEGNLLNTSTVGIFPSYMLFN